MLFPRNIPPHSGSGEFINHRAMPPERTAQYLQYSCVLLPRGRLLSVLSGPGEKKIQYDLLLRVIAKHGTLEPCKHHLRIHNLCIDDPEENVQCWLCSQHSATPEKFPSGSLRTLQHLTSQAFGRKFTILAPPCQHSCPGQSAGSCCRPGENAASEVN